MASSVEKLQAAIAGRYAIERELGRGGMATVYLAHDLKNDRQVAIKVLLPEVGVALGPERFKREIDIATKFSHPHVLPLYDSGDADGQLFYVMPFVEGESLREKLDREKQLSVSEAVRIAAEVADALDYAHRQNVIHRDIKPENILLEDGHALVADFGIARAAASAGEEKLTQTGITLGTPVYMSPEQAMADKGIDGRADIYSLGCVLYEMLSGNPPFVGPTAQAILARHALDQVPLLTIVRNAIPDEVEDVVLKALEKVPADRFQTAREFADALRAPHSPAGARRSTGGRQRTGERTGQRGRGQAPKSKATMWIAIGAVAVVAVAGFFGWRATKGRGGATAAGGLDPRRIAVLYFTDATRDSSLGFLASGLTDGLIAQLSTVDGLSVISQGGVSAYRGSALPADSIARALDAGTLVRGTVEREGDKVLVNVKLLEGTSGADFQRASFELPAKNITAIRDTLTIQVARLIRARLGEEVKLRSDRMGTDNADAWALLERAKERERAGTAAMGAGDSIAMLKSFFSADSLLAAAAAMDGSWPEPEIRRGTIDYKTSRFYRANPLRASSWIDKGLMQAQKAATIAPNNADALEILGTLRYWRYLLNLETDPRKSKALLDSARANLEASTKISRSQASAWAVLSHLYYQYNDVSSAKLAARSAYEEDAFLSNADVVLWRLFTSSYDLEQIPDAMHWCAEGARRYPGDVRFMQCQMRLMIAKQVPANVPLAWRLADSIQKLTPESDRPLAKLQGEVLVAAALARAGQADSARRLLARIDDPADLDPTKDLTLDKGIAYNLLGDKDQALKALAAYVAANPATASDLNSENNWMWRNLRDDPRFQALAKSSK
jgi:serine/threonine-protein kinase